MGGPDSILKTGSVGCVQHKVHEVSIVALLHGRRLPSLPSIVALLKPLFGFFRAPELKTQATRLKPKRRSQHGEVDSGLVLEKPSLPQCHKGARVRYPRYLGFVQNRCHHSPYLVARLRENLSSVFWSVIADCCHFSSGGSSGNKMAVIENLGATEVSSGL